LTQRSLEPQRREVAPLPPQHLRQRHRPEPFCPQTRKYPR
jgi:hypothetical protein